MANSSKLLAGASAVGILSAVSNFKLKKEPEKANALSTAIEPKVLKKVKPAAKKVPNAEIRYLSKTAENLKAAKIFKLAAFKAGGVDAQAARFARTPIVYRVKV